MSAVVDQPQKVLGIVAPIPVAPLCPVVGYLFVALHITPHILAFCCYPIPTYLFTQ